MKKINVWLVIAPVAIFVISLLTKSSTLQLISAVSGVFYVILVAKEVKYGYAFGAINVISYSYIIWNKGMFGSAVLNCIYSLPIFIYGYVYWGRNEKTGKKILEFNGHDKIKLGILVCFAVFCYYLVVTSLTKISAPLVDSIVSVCGLIGNILMAKKYVEQWWLWLAINITNITYWTINSFEDIANISFVCMYVIYFVNTLVGLKMWKNSMKERNNKALT